MTSPSAESRAVTEVRIPAVDLRPGDLVNLSPGEDDWQQVLGVYLRAEDVPAQMQDERSLVESLGGRYVLVELTDLSPVDNTVYFSDGHAFVEATSESGEDDSVADVASSEDGVRRYLYTKFELVTVRA